MSRVRDVAPAFLAPNKSSANHACFQNLSAELDYLLETPTIFSLSASLGVRAANPAGTARHRSGHRRSPRAAQVPLSTTLPGIPGLPRSRWSARLAIIAIPKITPTPEKPEKPTKSLPPSLLIFLGFS
jgi:hypothetical protein